MANETKYWKGLAQLNNEEKFVEKQQSEFAEYIPVEEFIGDKATLESSNTNRRDFLKFLGFSTVAATLAACEAPVTKAIPYVNRPEEITPGVANWYASTYYDGNDYAAILVKTREGRPIKIEGNTASKINMGGTNARVQSSVLSLYDSKRLTGPVMRSGKSWATKTWADIDSAIAPKLEASKGIAILSSTIISPSTQSAIAEFSAKYKNVRHVMYDAVSYSGIMQANLSSFGSAFVPTYRFDNADVIVSLGCDFLVNWVSPIEHARQYAATRKVSADKKTMSKHYQFESIMSLTGSNADERFPVKPSQLGQVALGLLGAVGGSGSSNVLSKEVAKAGAALKAAGSKGLVVCGSNDPALQMIVNEINNKIGAYGSTINKDVTDLTHQGDDAALKKLVEDMGSTIDTVIFYNTNPCYTAPKALGFDAAVKKLSCAISFAPYRDETASKCDFILPDHHFLESWNDYNPRAGHYSLQQPAIRPLFSTRHAQESFLAWSGNKMDYHSYMQRMWGSHMMRMQELKGDFNAFWNKSVQEGVAELAPQVHTVTEPQPDAVKPKSDSAQTETAAPVNMTHTAGMTLFMGAKMSMDEAVSKVQAMKGAGQELVIYQSTALGNGNQSMNPWLQEMPDPITKIAWDNYVTMHPMDVKEMGLFGVEGDDLMVQWDNLEDQLSMVTVTANGHSVQLPVWFQPGQARGTVGVAIGYGRKGFGEMIDNIGQNIYPAAAWSSTGNVVFETNVSIAKAEGTYPVASTQVHGTIMGRSEDILRETSLAVFAAGKKEEYNPALMMHTYKGEQEVENINLWNDFERPNHQWAMAIDLNSCIGCGACVVSCNAENNVPVVGKNEVRRSREMHWIRIDRYYSSNTVKEKAEEEGEMGTKEMYRKMENPAFDNPKVVFQPVMCMHCNHAPCETVCPVLATNHSSEGLNQMAYNRCVGTRYCANNCPYKVRRFNWFNYNDYHRFKGINPAQDEVGRMVLNPDVVVRARGVMEKCTMCVQRIQSGKLDAKKAGRRPNDGEIVTACAQACPTNAIIFGDLNDENSAVSKLHKDDRKFEMLEVTGTRPSVFYLAKVWNRENANDHV
jgi:MoCo/4Fe-4S cofactor protein with predicted Tat translocation signal